MWGCDTMKGMRQADDLFCLFWRETKKKAELEISTQPEVGKGTPFRGVGRRNPQKAVGEGRAEGQSTADSRRDQSAWDRVQEQWEKTIQDESTFLVVLWKFRKGCTSALIYRCTRNAVSRNHPSCTWVNPSPYYSFVLCSFSPAPSVVFLVP